MNALMNELIIKKQKGKAAKAKGKKGMSIISNE